MRIRAHVRPVLPLQRIAFLREVERVEHVGTRRDDVHRVVHDQRLPLVAASTPVEKVHTGCRRVAFADVISASLL